MLAAVQSLNPRHSERQGLEMNQRATHAAQRRLNICRGLYSLQMVQDGRDVPVDEACLQC